MNEVVGVSLDNEERITYFYTNDLKLKKNITVMVETDHGLEFGRVDTVPHPIDNKSLKKPLYKIARVATKKDYVNYCNNKKKADEALKDCKKLSKQYGLDMNIIDAFYTFDRSQLIFHFTSENRVDFRDLARELAALYKTRIELRQVGVRDKAKKVCGYGSCGQKLCCSRFLNEFSSVSISMAKNQNISLNPTKINGVCGRLLCCLKYEDELYREKRKNMPDLGKTVNIKEGKGKVISLDILNQKYVVDISDVGQVEVKI